MPTSNLLDFNFMINNKLHKYMNYIFFFSLYTKQINFLIFISPVLFLRRQIAHKIIYYFKWLTECEWVVLSIDLIIIWDTIDYLRFHKFSRQINLFFLTQPIWVSASLFFQKLSILIVKILNEIVLVYL